MVNQAAHSMTDDLKRKLKAIKRLAQDAGTEAEGVAAMMAFQRLLASNGLNEAQASACCEDNEAPKVNEVSGEDSLRPERFPKYITALRSIIASHFRCIAITHRVNGMKWFTYVGMGDDPCIAQSTFEAAVAVIDRMWLRHADSIRIRRSLTRGDKYDYATAFAKGLHSAYKAQEATTELGLMVLRDKAVDDHVSGLRTEKLSLKPASDRTVERLGYIDGNNFGRGNALGECTTF